MEVYVDGGIRRGTDVLKALCLGAKAVGLGRPFLYAQSAYGEDGVVKAVQSTYRPSSADDYTKLTHSAGHCFSSTRGNSDWNEIAGCDEDFRAKARVGRMFTSVISSEMYTRLPLAQKQPSHGVPYDNILLILLSIIQYSAQRRVLMLL
jgi:glutamate synthase domain-containing protein 2